MGLLPFCAAAALVSLTWFTIFVVTGAAAPEEAARIGLRVLALGILIRLIVHPFIGMRRGE